MIMRTIKSVLLAILAAVLLGWVMYNVMLPPIPIIWLNITFVVGGITALVMYLWCYFAVFRITT